jgi:putative ABC transport system ATP-binding protein
MAMTNPGAHRAQSPTFALALLLYNVADAVGAPVDSHQLPRVVRELRGLEREGWMRCLEVAAASTGMRVRWLCAPPAEATAMARGDLPVVTWCEDPTGGRWVVVGERLLGWARVSVIANLTPPRWLRPAALQRELGDEARPWALIEPAQPASLASASSSGPATPLRRVRTLLAAEQRDLGAVVVYAVAVGVLSLATPLVMQVLINWLAFGAVGQPLGVLVGALLACLSGAALLRGFQRVAVEMVQRRIFVRMVADLAGRLSRVRIEAFDRAYGPELVNRFFDVLTVQKAVSALVLDGAGAALQAAVGLLLLAFYHPSLLVFDLAVVVVGGALIYLLGRGATKTAIYESKAKYEVAGWIEDLARHPILFKTGGASRLALERADALSRKYLEYREAHFRIYLRQFAGTLSVQVLATVSLLALGGQLVLDGQLTVGQLVAAEFIVASALAGLAKFVGKLDSYYDLLAGVDKLGSLVDLPQERSFGLVMPRREGAASVALRAAGFSFPGAAGGLEPMDLEVAPGERLAILAPPGSGKSTLAELILGFRLSTGGYVVRDGVDVRSWQPEALHLDSCLVRGVDLVHGTVEENVSLGRHGVDSVAVWRALETAGVARAIGALSDGIEAQLGPTGAPLSNGQALRLMLARALAGTPRLLVIDGLFDRVPKDERAALMAPFLAADAPWTLIVLTEDSDVADRLVRRVSLEEVRCAG